MAFRFFKRLKLAPGLSLNLSKAGGSLSAGPPGAKLTAGTSGSRKTVGIPGTGLYWYETDGGSSRSTSRRGSGRANDGQDEPAPRPEDRLDLGFFDRLLISQGEEDFVDGMRQLVAGDEQTALRHLSRATTIPDAAFMAGLLALKREQFDQAESSLKLAGRKHQGLGKYCEKYGISASAQLPLTEHVVTLVEPGMRGVLLALAETHQARDQWRDAFECLKKLYQRDGEEIGVTLSLAELLVEDRGDKAACKKVVEIAEGVDNESPLHAGLLLFKGKALAKLGLHTAARDALTAAFRRKKDRPIF